MQVLKTTKSAQLRALEMYREDLDRLLRPFHDNCRDVTIADDSNSYDSFDEMEVETASKITKLDIRGDKPAVHFVFNETRRELGPQGPYNVGVNELRTEEISDTADVSFWRI